MRYVQVRRSNYYKRLNQILDDAFSEADVLGLSFRDLARLSGLHYRTILRLNYRITEYPELNTVMLVCKAVGLNLTTAQPGQNGEHQ
jgi:hypothetical protein